MKNICKYYSGNQVINDFNLSVESGEMIALIGKSGAGKSTILNIIGLLEKYKSGSMELFGSKKIAINSKEARVLHRDKIGYLFQNFALIDSKTVFENLKLAVHGKYHRNIEKKIANALARVDLKGYEKKKVHQLSGGEQQRVAMARLILKPCELILADEPTGSLDVENRERVMNLLIQLKKAGKTIIVVTHDDIVANLCDRVVQISK